VHACIHMWYASFIRDPAPDRRGPLQRASVIMAALRKYKCEVGGVLESALAYTCEVGGVTVDYHLRLREWITIYVFDTIYVFVPELFLLVFFLVGVVPRATSEQHFGYCAT